MNFYVGKNDGTSENKPTNNCTINSVFTRASCKNTNIGPFVPCIIIWNDKSIKRINAVNQIEEVNISFLSLNGNERKKYPEVSKFALEYKRFQKIKKNL